MARNAIKPTGHFETKRDRQGFRDRFGESQGAGRTSIGRAGTSIGARRCEHVAPETRQGAVHGMARKMSHVVRRFEQNIALQDLPDDV